MTSARRGAVVTGAGRGLGRQIAELLAARGQEESVAELQRRLDELDGELRAARDGVARREYATVLAQLETVRAELSALQSSADAVDAGDWASQRTSEERRR